MRHIIRKAVLAPTPEVEISPEEYSLLGTARGVLSSALAIEAKYEILIANFLALETQLLHIAATNAVRNTNNTLTYSEFFEIRSVLNVHVVNLLTAARLYLDQLPQDVADCLPENPDAADLVKARCSKEYDEQFEYRFMEALRNHVQHRGIPLHFVRQGTSFEEDGRMEFTVDILAQRRYLEKDEKFKKAILDEITGDVDLKAACRRYVESLSAINEFARGLIAEPAKSARARLEATHKRYAEVYSEKLIGLTASAMDDGREISSVPLLLDWDDVRLELQKRNSQLVNLRKKYVTGRTMKDKK